MVLHEQKLERILSLLDQQPYWTSSDLSEKLKISRSTVQKCLQELHERNMVERIHGGVKRRDHSIARPVPVNDRIELDKTAKEAICEEAMRLLPQAGYVYLDAGTTLLPLAERLGTAGSETGLVFVTNDPAIATVLAKARRKHILLGGEMHPVTQTISGSLSLGQIMSFHFDLCFVSADAISDQGKVTAAIAEEAALKRQAMTQSQSTVLLAASSKWAKCSGTIIAEIKDFDSWVIEKSRPEIAAMCKRFAVKLIPAK